MGERARRKPYLPFHVQWQEKPVLSLPNRLSALWLTLRSKVTNNGTYFNGILAAYVSQALQMVAQIILIPLYVNHLGEQYFGVLMIVMTTMAATNIIATWSIGGITRRFGDCFSRDDIAALRVRYAAAKYVFLGFGGSMILIETLIGLAICGYVYSKPGAHVDYDVVLTIIFAAVNVFLTVDNMVEVAALTAKNRLSAAYALQIESLIVFFFCVVMWFELGGGLAGVFPSMIAGAICSRITVWFYWRRQGLQLRWRCLRDEVRVEAAQLFDTLKRGYPMYSLIFAGLQMDTVVLGILGNPVVVGKYVLIWKIAEVGIFLIWRFSENLQPEIFRAFDTGDRERVIRIYRLGIRSIAAISALAAIVYALFGNWLVRIWIGSGAVPEDWLAYALAGAAIFWLGTARLSQIVAFSSSNLKGLIRVSAVELVARLAIFAVLAPFVGYLAPLIAINAVHALGCAYAYVKIARAGVAGRR